ncbi:MAG: AmmeMemoRadiSam system radical SAM enzyme [Elusimicrobia bacterium]|nr:AmmeMemoRadiSam system radical SAM enzyme [Elusimicrobiota bacterium]
MKRRLLRVCGALLLSGMAFASWNWSAGKAPPGHECRFYKTLFDGQVQCRLCPRKCIVPEGKRGTCGIRENRGGKLYLITYGKPCSLGNEPIEKAPFFHFLPGTRRLVLATVGCVLRCRFCQNWEISQAKFEDVPYREVSPEQAVAVALHEKVSSICFTFTEPTVYYEYMYDVAKLAHEKGLKTSMVSSGYIETEPLKELLKVLDAVKIDLKGFTEKFYEEMAAADLEPVLNSIKTVKQSGKWLEIVNLVIPGQNDDPKDLQRMCLWLKENAGADTPVHFTRFFPQYKLKSVPPTPVASLVRAYGIAKAAGLRYVYVGNVPGHPMENTACPKCGKTLIERQGYQIVKNALKGGRCPYCSERLRGLW